MRYILACFVLVFLVSCTSQTHSIAIAEPTSGTVVKVGQTVLIHVSTQGNFDAVAITAETPLGWGVPVGASQNNFTLLVPDAIAPGQYGLLP